MTGTGTREDVFGDRENPPAPGVCGAALAARLDAGGVLQGLASFGRLGCLKPDSLCPCLQEPSPGGNTNTMTGLPTTDTACPPLKRTLKRIRKRTLNPPAFPSTQAAHISSSGSQYDTPGATSWSGQPPGVAIASKLHTFTLTSTAECYQRRAPCDHFWPNALASDPARQAK